MSQQGFDGDARPEFWLAHIRAGVLLTQIGGALVLVYLLTDPELTQVPTLVGLLTFLMVGTGAILLLPLRRIIAHPRAALFFYAWSMSATAVITAGCALDGGGRSPFVAYYFLVLVYAATAYPPDVHLRVSAAIVVAYLAVAMTDPVGIGAVAVVAGALTLTAWMSAIATRNHWDQLQAQVRLARIDGLTGCLNQRAFRDVLDVEVERARRFGHPLALLLVDLDEFKNLNDRFGHLAGDAALASTGQVLRRMVRGIDVVGRIGGDEFALLLIQTELDRAIEVAERLRRRVQAAVEPERTTVSVGVAPLPRGGTATMLLADADVALYAAKRAGRDTVRSHVDASSGDDDTFTNP